MAELTDDPGVPVREKLRGRGQELRGGRRRKAASVRGGLLRLAGRHAAVRPTPTAVFGAALYDDASREGAPRRRSARRWDAAFRPPSLICTRVRSCSTSALVPVPTC